VCLLLPELVHEARQDAGAEAGLGSQDRQAAANLVRGYFRIIKQAVDLLAGLPGYISRQRRVREAAVFIKEGVAEERHGGTGLRLARARYPSPSLLNYPLYYPLRSETLPRNMETLMRLSGGGLTCDFRVNTVYARQSLMRVSRVAHERLMRRSRARRKLGHSGMLRALVVRPLRRVQVAAATDGEAAN
jgi:hypothetical protein